MQPLVTRRLRLVPATSDLIRSEIEDIGAFFRRLDVAPASDWPSEALAEILPHVLHELERDPMQVGWQAWYWICDSPSGRVLVGGGGFKGKPANGIVEIGYETRAAYRRQGFAVEAVCALVDWALIDPCVNTVVAHADAVNAASIGVLRKCGFDDVGGPDECGVLRFEVSPPEI
jgi:[ribosomal protein S5]-alanine N-acetyltransferase